VISSTQRNLPDNAQHSQDTDFHASGSIRTRNPRKQIHALNRAPTGYGSSFINAGSLAMLHHNLLLGYEVQSVTRNSAFRNVTAYCWLGSGHPMHDWHRDFSFRYILQDRSGAQLSSCSTSKNSCFIRNKSAYYSCP